jgi:hypothetical protein
MHLEQLVLITANKATVAAISVPTAPPLLVDAISTVRASNLFSAVPGLLSEGGLELSLHVTRASRPTATVTPCSLPLNPQDVSYGDGPER